MPIARAIQCHQGIFQWRLIYDELLDYLNNANDDGIGAPALTLARADDNVCANLLFSRPFSILPPLNSATLNVLSEQCHKLLR